MKRLATRRRYHLRTSPRSYLATLTSGAFALTGGFTSATATPLHSGTPPQSHLTTRLEPSNDRFEWQFSAETAAGTLYSIYDTDVVIEGELRGSKPPVRDFDEAPARVIVVPPSGPPQQLTWHQPLAPTGCGQATFIASQMASLPTGEDLTKPDTNHAQTSDDPQLKYKKKLLPWVQWQETATQHVFERALVKGRAYVGPTPDGWFEFDKATKKLIRVTPITDTETEWGDATSIPKSYACSRNRFGFGYASGHSVTGSFAQPGLNALDTGHQEERVHAISESDIVYSAAGPNETRLLVRQPVSGATQSISTSATNITSAVAAGTSVAFTGWENGRLTPNAWLVEAGAAPRVITANDSDAADQVWASPHGIKMLHRPELGLTTVETLNHDGAKTSRRLPPASFLDVSLYQKRLGPTSITWATDHEIADWSDVDGRQRFEPNRRMTRGDAATWMYRFAGSPSVTMPSQSPVPDISASDADYAAIIWALQRNLIEPREINGTRQFRRDDSLERGEAAEMAYTYAGRPEVVPPAEPAFTDVPADHEHFRAITWYWQNWLDTAGKRYGTDFGPDDPWQRHQAAIALRKLSTISPWQGAKK